MKFYTRTGDDGYTGLLGDARVPKYAPRPEAYGTIDELSSALGLARATAHAQQSRDIILSVQRQLYRVMTELASAPEVADRFERTTATHVSELEQLSDKLGAQLEMPREFIVPGDTLAGAALDLARTVARRAERLIVRMVHEGELDNAHVMRYLNRLSSLLFVLARYEDAAAGMKAATVANKPRTEKK